MKNLLSPTNKITNGNLKRANKMKFNTKKYLAAPFVAALLSLSAGAAIAADTHYDVTVQTGSHKHAATDSAIYITIYGTKGQSPRFLLNIPHFNDNEIGQKTTYTITTPNDLGHIKKIVAFNSYDNDNKGPGWQLSYMSVKKEGYGAIHFPCYRWLAVPKTTRILYPNRSCR